MDKHSDLLTQYQYSWCLPTVTYGGLVSSQRFSLFSLLYTVPMSVNRSRLELIFVDNSCLQPTEVNYYLL
jgi:hypothetical protein